MPATPGPSTSGHGSGAPPQHHHQQSSQSSSQGQQHSAEQRNDGWDSGTQSWGQHGDPTYGQTTYAPQPTYPGTYRDGYQYNWNTWTQPQPLTSVPPQPAATEFSRWLTSKGVTATNIAVLTTSGFNDIRTLQHITEDDCTTLNIGPLGQRRLVLALTDEEDYQSGGPRNTRDLTASLGQLFRNVPTADQPSSSTSRAVERPARATGESRSTLATMFLLPQKKAQYLDIVDFVEKNYFKTVSEDVETCLSASDDIRVLLKTGTKVKLENVTPMQWTGASLRILAELVNRGSIVQDDMFCYLAYMAKICQLTEGHTWQSVLMYDRAYRQLQAQHQFEWGSDYPHLSTVHLLPRNVPSGNASKSADNKQKKAQKSDKSAFSRQGASSEVCKLFNHHGECPYNDKCRYRHVCSECGKPHPFLQHPSPSDKSGGKTNDSHLN